jgi:site-specific DNA-methyltransferase (adenine-specific)
MSNKLIHGDCLTELAKLPRGIANLILTDLPFGSTRNKWDIIIPLDKLWKQFARLLAPNGAIALNATNPFASMLINSNPRWYKYEWIWVKDAGTGFLNSKKQPLRKHELVLIFYPKQPIYNPQYTEGNPYSIVQGSQSTDYGHYERVLTENNGYRYPTTVIKIPREKPQVHPTQKPVALGEYMIDTYTNCGDTVLDCTCGVASYGVAAIKKRRRYIGIDNNIQYLEIGLARMQEAERKLINV